VTYDGWVIARLDDFITVASFTCIPTFGLYLSRRAREEFNRTFAQVDFLAHFPVDRKAVSWAGTIFALVIFWLPCVLVARTVGRSHAEPYLVAHAVSRVVELLFSVGLLALVRFVPPAAEEEWVNRVPSFEHLRDSGSEGRLALQHFALDRQSPAGTSDVSPSRSMLNVISSWYDPPSGR
jgi:hypothetical protein